MTSVLALDIAGNPFRRLTSERVAYYHVLPRAHWGRDARENVVAACRRCNERNG